TRLRLPVRLRGRAPINPPRKLGITRSYNPPLPRTPVNRFRVRQTAVGYEANPATALVASAVIGPTTSKQRERYQSTATGYCINNSPNNAREEKQNAGCHDLAFFFFLTLPRGVVAGIVDAGRGGIIDPGYRFHGNASRSTFPPGRIIPTRCLPTSIFPS